MEEKNSIRTTIVYFRSKNHRTIGTKIEMLPMCVFVHSRSNLKITWIPSIQLIFFTEIRENRHTTIGRRLGSLSLLEHSFKDTSPSRWTHRHRSPELFWTDWSSHNLRTCVRVFSVRSLSIQMEFHWVSRRCTTPVTAATSNRSRTAEASRRENFGA